MIDLDRLVATYRSRHAHQAAWMARATEVRDIYNLETRVPLPELDRNEKVAVANLLAQGLDQTAMRIASTLPDLTCPPTKPGAKRAMAQAEIRRKAILGWWSQNDMRRKLRRRARWLIGYATAPVIIRPDFDRKIPAWGLRDPLSTYPCPSDDPDDQTPPDVIFAYQRPLGWLRKRYPTAARSIFVGPNPNNDMALTVLEYNDANETTLVVLGVAHDIRDRPDPSAGSDPYAVLESIPNRTGTCLAVVPNRITLDRPQGQFDSMVGMYQQQAMLQAMAVLAAKRSVFPDEWVMGDPNTTPQVIQTADGITGRLGLIKGGKFAQTNYQPGAQVPTYIDRLERYERITAGIPAEYGSESPSNIRTGRRGDAVLSAAIDFPIQEAQEVIASSLAAENTRAIAVATAYFGTQRSVFWVPWKGSRDRLDYIPNEVFDTDENYVGFAHAGADVNSLIVGLGQRLGTGMISVETAREIDPVIDDPEQEHDRIVAEGLERAMLQSLEQQATQGAIPPPDLARITELVMTKNLSLYEAVTKAHDEAQARQATPAENPAEAQPGLAQPGAGAEAPVIPDQSGGSMANLSMLLANLRRPQVGAGAALGAQGEAALHGAAVNA